MEGRRKEIFLLVLALMALGLALYTFRGKPTPAPPPSATGAGPAPVEGAAGVSIARPNDQQPGEVAQGAGETGDAAAQRNPFSAPGAAPAAVEPPPDLGFQSGDSESTAALDVSESGEGALTLTGIIDGRSTVAILRQKDQRFFVKVGDPIGYEYRVQSIGNQRVVLAGPQGKVILRMGGRQ